MSYSLVQIIIVASSSEGEDAFWSQILVLVVFAVLVGIGGLIKTKTDKMKRQQQYYPEGANQPHSWYQWQIKAIKELKDKYLGVFSKTTQPELVTEGPKFDFEVYEEKQKDEPEEENQRNLAGGMELLEMDFLLSIIEKTESDDENDVIMRKLSFNELLRRGQLIAADSNTLRVYAMDEDHLYGKAIQCGAMKELAERTRFPSNYSFELNESFAKPAADEPSTVHC